MKIGDVINVRYLGDQTDAKIISSAMKRSRRTGKQWWWLEVTPENRDRYGTYHWRFMRADHMLEKIKQFPDNEKGQNDDNLRT